MRKYLSLFFLVLIITIEFNKFSVNATGLEVPVIVGGGIIGTDAAINLAVSCFVALAGGSALDSYAKEEGFNNSYDFMKSKLTDYSSSIDTTLDSFSMQITNYLSYTEQGYLVIGNSFKELASPFLNSFNVEMSDITTTNYNGYTFGVIQANTVCMNYYVNRRPRKWITSTPHICYIYNDQMFFVSTEKFNFLTNRDSIYEDNDGSLSSVSPSNYYGTSPGSYKYNSYWRAIYESSYSSLPAFDYSNISDFSNVSEAERDNAVLGLLRSYTMPASSSIFDDAIPLIEDTTNPLVVDPDVLPNIQGVNAITPSDYADILANYYSNVYETPTYIIDDSQVINNYYSSSTSIEDEKPFVPSMPSDINNDIYTYSISEVFPFCIPFDIANIISIFKAEPEPLVIEFDLGLSSLGIVEDSLIHIDLAPWEPIAVVFRYSLDILFILGLAFFTRFLLRS